MKVEQIKIPILTYHSIDESGSVISTKPEVFRKQMKGLSEAGYEVVALSHLVESRSGKTSLPPKTVVLTFDDGFQNFYAAVFPVLQEYGFKATVFLVTDHCGGYNDWRGNPPDLQRSKLLSWREIKELSDHGIEFGAHTRTHPDLTRIGAERVENEIIESKKVIEDSIGREARTFAYPFGKFNPTIRRVVEKTFAAACSTNLGKVCPQSDFYTLERLDTYYLSNPVIFNSLSSKSFDRYMRVRQAMRDFKALLPRRQAN